MKVSSEVGPTDSFQRIEVKRHAPENPARNPAGTKVKTQRRPLEKPSESETALLNSASCRRELILMLEAHEEMHVKPHLVRYFQRHGCQMHMRQQLLRQCPRNPHSCKSRFFAGSNKKIAP